MSEQTRILDFGALAERHKPRATPQESVAEHCFQMALMALLVHPHLARSVDLCKKRRHGAASALALGVGLNVTDERLRAA